MCGCLQGVLLSVLLMKNKNRCAGYAFLLSYLLMLIAQLLMKIADKYWLMQNLRTTYSLSYQFPFLYGPLLCLFLRKHFDRNLRFTLKDGLHLLPFGYGVLYQWAEPLFALPSFFYWPLRGLQSLFLQWTSLAVYHAAAWRLWTAHCQTSTNLFSELQAFRLRWLGRFIITSFGVGMIISAVTVFLYITYPHYTYVRFSFVLLTVFVYWISYSALHQPTLFTAFVNDEYQPASEKQEPIMTTFTIHRAAKKYANSALSDVEASRIHMGLNQLMEEKKLFTNPELTIEQLAGCLHTSRHLLSQVLNQRLGQSFYEYVNKLRVAEAKRLLLDEKRQNQKIASLAYDAGFNSLSTFNDVFKKTTGLTPSQFRKQADEVSQKQRV